MSGSRVPARDDLVPLTIALAVIAALAALAVGWWAVALAAAVVALWAAARATR